MVRKRISNRAKLAALTMLHFGFPYAHAKKMTDWQMNSLVEWHHNVHHSAKGKQTIVEDVDHFSNLEPMLIAAHDRQTKRDQKTIAKIKRTRAKFVDAPPEFFPRALEAIRAGLEEGMRDAYDRTRRTPDRYSDNYDAIDWNKDHYVPKRKIRSRGFDKTRRRTMRGKVVKR
jgi:hypothetical protein